MQDQDQDQDQKPGGALLPISPLNYIELLSVPQGTGYYAVASTPQGNYVEGVISYSSVSGFRHTLSMVGANFNSRTNENVYRQTNLSSTSFSQP